MGAVEKFGMFSLPLRSKKVVGVVEFSNQTGVLLILAFSQKFLRKPLFLI